MGAAEGAAEGAVGVQEQRLPRQLLRRHSPLLRALFAADGRALCGLQVLPAVDAAFEEVAFAWTVEGHNLAQEFLHDAIREGGKVDPPAHTAPALATAAVRCS